jgi:molybdate transport system substrate-binding protein
VSRLAAALAVAAVLAAAGVACGGDGGDDGRPQLTVSAAASLKAAFTAYGRQFGAASARFSFAGSDELAAQIERGVRPDVFAAANTKLPEQLHREGLVEKPTVFAGNRLVLAVPTGSAMVASLADAGEPGISLAVGSASAPVGAYTRAVLDRLPAAQRAAILGNVRSEEPDVAGIVGKLGQGAVDAGFVYVTDVRGAGGRLEAIELPGALQPSVAYGAAVVEGAEHPEEARAFVAGLVSGAGRRALAVAGFEAPPP